MENDKHVLRGMSWLSRRDFFKYTGTLAGLYCAGHLFKGGIPDALAQEIKPRVVVVKDNLVTTWDGSSIWFGSNTYVNQGRVDNIVKQGVISLTGQSSELDAWSSLLPTVSGTTKIGIKVNANSFEVGVGNNVIDWTPQVVNAVIKGLKVRGFSEPNIYILDPSSGRTTAYCGLVTSLYPNVKLYGQGWQSRPYLASTYSSSDSSLYVTHSDTRISGQSKYPDQFLDIDYLIQMPQLKAHGLTGVSFTYKNLLGYLVRSTIGRLHNYMTQSSNNPLVDLYANTHIIEKTKLIIGDGIYGNYINNYSVPRKWSVFGNDWPKRLFFATDPVAIDCVMYDFVNWQNPRTAQHEYYLICAANADQGMRDHWNNPSEKKYSLIDFVQIDLNRVNRVDIDRKIRDFKQGNAPEGEVNDAIGTYMEGQ
jgi:hypothetical protein